MLKCIEVTELCSQELERPLRLAERLRLGAHFMMCTGCANYRQQMQALRRVARAYAEGRTEGDAPAEPAAR
jgi:hypothetical protein